jgi:Ser/Thr protein kinase RdoA (MazF antagonist)
MQFYSPIIMIKSILAAFKIDENSITEKISIGLINETYKITTPKNEAYILQKINAAIFKNPFTIEENIRVIADYFSTHYPEYLFTTPITLFNGKQLLHVEGEGYFRLFHFVENSKSYNVVSNDDQAFKAAVQFGNFTKLLSNIDINKIQTTIPDFHNLQLRFTQFENALLNGNIKKIEDATTEIEFLLAQKNIVDTYNSIIVNPNFKLRVTHHDTKISNVLFDKNDEALCVIDLDTVMPGYFISDVGDMMRTYICPVSEEENDFSKIDIRKDFYDAIVQGYLNEMQDELTLEEKKYFHYAGEFAIYMQALRFLTDYINDDVYYGSSYAKQNYNRAKNQIVLLQKYTAIQ